MAEFKRVVKERKRMCEQYNTCIYCPLRDRGNAEWLDEEYKGGDSNDS